MTEAHKRDSWPQDRNHNTDPISRVMGRMRLVSLLASMGIGGGDVGRCAKLVVTGRVTVNGQVVESLAALLNPERDRVMVDGQSLAVDQNWCRYVIVYKPYRVMSCFTDPEGRATLADYVKLPDVYTAGRLDYDSEGLLLLSDDGWLLHRITHPDYEHPKTYLAQVEHVPDEMALAALRAGIMVEGQRTRPAQVELLPDEPIVPPRSIPIRYRASIPTAWLRLVLYEGRKRQIRHMTAAVGHPTLRLIRVGIGPIALGDLQPGQSRELTSAELRALANMVARRRPKPSSPR